MGNRKKIQQVKFALENVDGEIVISDALLTSAVNFVQSLVSAGKLTRAGWRDVGRVLKKAKQDAGGNTQLLGEFRKKYFPSLDKHLISKAIWLANQWDFVEKWATENKPTLNNPGGLQRTIRPYVQEILDILYAHVCICPSAPEEETPEKDTPNEKDKNILAQFESAYNAIKKAHNDNAFNAESLAVIDAHVADWKKVRAQDKRNETKARKAHEAEKQARLQVQAQEASAPALVVNAK